MQINANEDERGFAIYFCILRMHGQKKIVFFSITWATLKISLILSPEATSTVFFVCTSEESSSNMYFNKIQRVPYTTILQIGS